MTHVWVGPPMKVGPNRETVVKKGDKCRLMQQAGEKCWVTLESGHLFGATELKYIQPVDQGKKSVDV